jgi:hypothetical protein
MYTPLLMTTVLVMLIPEYTPGLMLPAQHDRTVLELGSGRAPASGSRNGVASAVGVGVHVLQVAPPDEPYLYSPIFALGPVAFTVPAPEILPFASSSPFTVSDLLPGSTETMDVVGVGRDPEPRTQS